MTQSIGNFPRGVPVVPNSWESAGTEGTDPKMGPKRLESEAVRAQADSAFQRMMRSDRNTFLPRSVKVGLLHFQQGVRSFWGGIKKFSFSRIPESITVTMPDNTDVTLPGDFYEGMLKTVPRRERMRVAREELPGQIQSRLVNGRETLFRVLNGQEKDNVPSSQQEIDQYQQNVADMAIYLQLKAAQGGKPFTRGAFSVEDPQGYLAKYLERSPEKYLRSSSHLKGQQGAEVDGHRNTHRGIDVEPGITGGLLGTNQTLAFATVPGDENHDVSRRLWLKPEPYGCRLSTMSKNDLAEGMRGLQLAPVREARRSDVLNALSHGKEFVSSKLSASGGNYASYRERVPSSITGAMKALKAEILPMSPTGDANVDAAMDGLNLHAEKPPELTLGEMVRKVSDLRNAAVASNVPGMGSIRQICDQFLSQAAEVTKAQSMHPGVGNNPENLLAEAKARLGEEVMLDTRDL